MTIMTTTDVLVGTDWLQAHLDDPSLAIIEVDEDTTAFGGGHIPGSIGIDWTTDLRDGLRRDFVSAEGLAALLGSKGISMACASLVAQVGNCAAPSSMRKTPAVYSWRVSSPWNPAT